MPDGKWRTNNVSGGGSRNLSGGTSSSSTREVSSGFKVEPRTVVSSDVQTKFEQASGIIKYDFGFANLVASQSALQATMDHAGTQSTVSARMPYAGSVIGLGVEGNTAMTAGTAIFTVYIEGESTGAELDWFVGTTGDTITFNPGTYVFDPQDLVDVRVETASSFAPTTVDVAVSLYVSFSS